VESKRLEHFSELLESLSALKTIGLPI
jgi:hypothetical protein